MVVQPSKRTTTPHQGAIDGTAGPEACLARASGFGRMAAGQASAGECGAWPDLPEPKRQTDARPRTQPRLLIAEVLGAPTRLRQTGNGRTGARPGCHRADR